MPFLCTLCNSSSLLRTLYLLSFHTRKTTAEPCPKMSSGAEIYYEPSGCNCNGTSYTKQDINTAASRALELASEGQTLGECDPRPL